MELDDKERKAFLRDEYLLLQNQYEDFDRRSLQIKGWLTGGAIAALGLAFNSESPVAASVPIATAIIAAVIWYHEAKWKLFQYALTDRIRVIEAYFRGDPEMPEPQPSPFQVYNSWYRSYSEDLPLYPYEARRRPAPLVTRLWRAARQRFVATLYVAIIAMSAVALVLMLLFPRIATP